MPNCLITQKSGTPIQSMEGSELAALYQSYYNQKLPDSLVVKYFQKTITEYSCPSSGLIWFTPAFLGESDFYETLGSIFPWYYQAETWDKNQALNIIERQKYSRVIEIGCGEGHFLKRLEDRGIKAVGIDINSKAVAKAKELGLSAYTPDGVPGDLGAFDCLCLFQTIEHLGDPLGVLKKYVALYKTNSLIISAPSSEGLLGLTSDPLSWPPHHASLWSRRAFEVLAEKLEFRLASSLYDPVSLSDIQFRLNCERNKRLPGIPYLPKGRIGRAILRIFKVLGFSWANRNHSILVTLVRH